MSEELQLMLLGNLEMRLDGVPVKGFISSKVQALLCYLAVTGRPCLRPTLAGLLWGEMPEVNARNNLSKALTNLRQLVRSYLTIDRLTVTFNRDSPYSLDTELFTFYVKNASAETDINKLQYAVKLYRGDFLEGFHVRHTPAFEDWGLIQRAQMRELAVQAISTLASHHVKRGEIGLRAAIFYITRLLTLEPWREQAHRRLMVLLVQSGQRNAALAQYEVCRQVLAKELGVEPTEETLLLYKQIRDGTLKIPTPIRTPGASLKPAHFPVIEDTRKELTGPLFVARDKELEHLNGLLKSALTGEGRIVFITGEAGSGKTALVEEFIRRIREAQPNLVVARGNCNAYTGAADPYLPFREILRQLTNGNQSRWDPGSTHKDSSSRLRNLAFIPLQSLPETDHNLIDAFLVSSSLTKPRSAAAINDRFWLDNPEGQIGSSESTRGNFRQTDLFEQYTAFLKVFTDQHPLLLMLDDLQWADAGSIDLLFHLSRRIDHYPILITGIYRPTEVALGREDKRHPLAPVIHEIQRKFGPIIIDLSQSDDRKFIEAFLNSESNRLSGSFREALRQKTKGNALFTVEIVRDMMSRGDLVKDDEDYWIEGTVVDWSKLPARVEGIISERIDRLPATMRETLKVACVEGYEFTAEIVAQVLAIKAYEIVSLLSEELDRRHQLVVSVDSQRISPDGKLSSRYRFRHILFQEYLYQSLSKVERSYIHEAIGNALEHVYGGQTETIAIQLAHHFYATARMDKAMNYLLQAGDRARSLYAYAEAYQHYTQALDTLEEIPDTTENRHRRIEILIALTECSERVDSAQKNLKRLAEAEQLIQKQLDHNEMPEVNRLLLARVHFRTGQVYRGSSAYRKSISYFQQVQSTAEESNNVELTAISSSGIGQVKTLQGYLVEAEILLSQAIPILEQTDNWSEWFRALAFHGITLAMMGKYAQGLAEVKQAGTWARETNARSEIIQSQIQLTMVHIHGGNPSRAVEVARQVVEGVDYIYSGNHFLSWALSRAGEYEMAAVCIAKSEALAQKLGGRLSGADWLAAFKAEIAYGAGRFGEALNLAEKAVGIAKELGGIFAEGIARRIWGQALAALAPQNWVDAENQLAQSLHLFEKGQVRSEAARTHMAWGAVCRDRGNLADARIHWEKAIRHWETHSLTRELERTCALIESLDSR